MLIDNRKRFRRLGLCPGWSSRQQRTRYSWTTGRYDDLGQGRSVYYHLFYQLSCGQSLIIITPAAGNPRYAAIAALTNIPATIMAYIVHELMFVDSDRGVFHWNYSRPSHSEIFPPFWQLYLKRNRSFMTSTPCIAVADPCCKMESLARGAETRRSTLTLSSAFKALQVAWLVATNMNMKVL
jgi:hypothetical protein